MYLYMYKNAYLNIYIYIYIYIYPPPGLQPERGVSWGPSCPICPYVPMSLCPYVPMSLWPSGGAGLEYSKGPPARLLASTRGAPRDLLYDDFLMSFWSAILIDFGPNLGPTCPPSWNHFGAKLAPRALQNAIQVGSSF